MMMTTTSSSCFCRCSFTTKSRRRTCSSITLLSNLLFVFIILLIVNQNHNHHYEGFAYAASSDNKILTNQEKKAFELLVKTINQLPGGYVHPSIGLMSPAPFTGATRGVGIINNKKGNNKDNNNNNNDILLIKVPYEYQMTRDLALTTLTTLIPYNVLQQLPLNELDDAALLVLLLAHEYGLGKKSKFYAYIQTLPQNGCESIDLASNDFRFLPNGVDPADIEQALLYLQRVSVGLSNDYGLYLEQSNWSKEWKEQPNLALRWGLCIVSSRATAANPKPGINTGETSVRLVPLADFANHLITSGGFIELSGQERLIQGDFIDANPMIDAGSFVVRSTWKDGTTKPLAVGDEITVNYNLPEYTAIDWFLSLGFVPPELSIIPTKNHNGGGGEL